MRRYLLSDFSDVKNYRRVSIWSNTLKHLTFQTMFCNEVVLKDHTVENNGVLVTGLLRLSYSPARREWLAKIEKRIVVRAKTHEELMEGVLHYLNTVETPVVIMPIRYLTDCPCKKGVTVSDTDVRAYGGGNKTTAVKWTPRPGEDHLF